ncbi:hypothetical protein [Sphingorhabdus sp. M41]|uniref:hypothetical protein n=1 Tax=Sphingorhabdus sp. M41 TaxID=1806885 RepID=UPI00078CFA8E|nr:hypothetical protein [Sphingorhabdus sp. M41]AMO72083.1 hypothetical protein AZE99_09705 [Sphingorhabdus sp. M41]
MMPRLNDLRLLLVAGGLAMLAACQTAPPPPPPAPVVQPQYTPRAPTPPFGASNLTIVPSLRIDGMRDTINRDLGPLETLWHVRAALNVAALSCTGPLYERLVDDYNAFISNNSASLRNANNAIIRKFQRETGAGYKTEHDRHQTQLYNYWSFSPLRRPFCDQAVQVSQRAIVTKSADLNAFAEQALSEMEKPFTDFYLAYEEYERDLQAWQVQYGQPAADVTRPATELGQPVLDSEQPAPGE